MDDPRVLYQLMISQLRDDGYHGAAAAVADATMLPCAPAKPHRLAKMVQVGIAVEAAGGSIEQGWGPETAAERQAGAARVAETNQGELSFGDSAQQGRAARPEYSTPYSCAHKEAATAAAFSPDGAPAGAAAADGAGGGGAAGGGGGAARGDPAAADAAGPAAAAAAAAAADAEPAQPGAYVATGSADTSIKILR